MRDGAAAARVAHNHEVAGASPAPATMSPADRANAVVEEFRRAIGREPTDAELILNLADKLERAEAGRSPGFLRETPSYPMREPKKKPPEPVS